QGAACNTEPCVAGFNFQFPDCTPTVSFTNTSTGPAPLTYFWNFGYSSNGIPNTSSAANPFHAFPAQCATYNVCLTVTGNGCSNTICKNVVIKYPQQPVLTCPPNITVACNTNLSPTVTGFATLTGACSGQNPNITFSDNTSGIMPCNGTVLRTWTALDECGVTRTCVQTITVRDNVPPVAMCAPGQGYDLNSDCTLPVTVDMINSGSTDNCQIQSMSVNPTVVTGCGIFPITLTVTDLCGNMSTCTTEIQTIEVVPPMIICPQDISLTCGDDLSPAATGMATATDNCDPNPVITFTDVVTGTLCNALIARTWTARDNCGNEATCVQNIVVIDNVPPTIACPQDMTVNTDPGQCFFSGILPAAPTVTDNCNPDPAITCYLVTPSGLVLITPGMQFPKGTHSICCVADDGCVDVSELICTYPCTTGGNVQVPEPPLDFLQNTISSSPQQEALAVLGVQPGISGNVLVNDVLVGGNCFDISNVTTQGQASQFGVFTNGQTNIGFDAGVILTTGPGTLAVGPNNSDNAGSGVGGLTPDAQLSTLTTGTLYDKAALEFDFIPTQSTVTLNFVFASEEYCEKVGNPLTDVFGIFISGPGISGGQQNIALVPSTTTPVGVNTVNHLNFSGFYQNNQPASSANLCGQSASTLPSVTELQYDGYTRKFTAIANVQPGQTYHLKLAIADVGDDLHDSAIFLDAGSFDAGGNASVEWAVNSNPVSDIAYENCGTVNLVFDRVGGSINLPLSVPYTITGSATAGLDYVPFASTIVIPAGQSQFTLPVTILNDAILEGDETIIITLNNVCSFLMPQKTLTIKDKSLLQAKCTFTLTVEDHELPMIMCAPNVSVTGTLNGQGVCTAVVGNLAPTVSDNCPMLMVEYVITGATTATGVNDASGTTFLAGTSVVTYTATDMSGNMVTCQTQVTVTCPPTPCTASFTVNFIDNCGHVQLISTSTGQQPISYQWSTSESTPNIDLMLPCGQHTFSVSITCADGSMSSATQTINIVDNIPPTIVCPPDVQLTCFSPTTPGTTGIGFATATDNCSILSITYTDVVTGTQPCNQVITRTWRAEDWCNNISTCVQTITVMDNIPPVLTNCPQNISMTGTLNGNGVCTANVQVTSPTATDLCDQAVMLTNSFNGTANASGTYPQGTTTVTWTATDHCGNTATCSFDVTVACNTDICCPEFSLLQLDSISPCPGDVTCMRDSVGLRSPIGSGGGKKIACKNSVHTYYIVPNLSGFTYTWNVIGGTPASFTGNPGVITWGSDSEGSIEVIIADASGNCRDTITHEFCLLDAPVASFTVAPIPGTTICANQSVTFTNTSVGASSYYWDFGDGTSSTAQNPPPHTFPGPGMYTVLLTASNGTTGNADVPKCGCIDTATTIITVIVGTGPTITPECKEMLCPGDITNYCTALGCAPYNWTVNGGTITANNGNCITVQWNTTAPATLPASVSVTTGCTSNCGSSATLNVPVLWNNIPISGPTPVCVGSTETYSLPAMPGTFYTWTVSGGGGVIVGANQNTPAITVKWNGPVGPATITCNYDNPYSGCSGSSTKTVDVRLKFDVFGPASICANAPNPAFFSSNGLANWTISPANNGYSIVGATTGTSFIGVNWTIPGTYTITATPNPAIFCNPSEVIQVVVNPAPVITIAGPLIVCRGQLYDYMATSTLTGGSFSWSFTGPGTGTISPYGPDNANASVLFTGQGPWTLMVSQTVDGCTGSTTITIANDLPPILAPTSLTSCIGGQITVSVQPGSGPGPYTWSTSSAASFIGELTPGTATYEIHGSGMIMVSNCSGPSNSVNVGVTNPPTISISQTGTLCAGNAQLNAIPAGPAGTTYLWFGGGTPVPPNSLAVSDPGIYSVQVTFPDGCISVANYPVMPEVVPSVSISTGDALIWCLPNAPAVLLQAFSTTPGCSYQWHDSGGPISGATNQTYTATAAGSYYVVVTCGACVATSNVINVVVLPNCPPTTGCTTYPVPPNPPPLSAITVSSGCNPKTFSVNVMGCAGGVVLWNFGDGTSATGSTVTHTYTSHGTFPVTASITCNGCSFDEYTKVDVPVVADFNYSVQCGANGSYTIMFNNTSQTLGGWTFNPSTDVVWTSTCGTPLSGSGNSFTLNTPANCNPMVTMNITVNDPATGDICTDSKTIPLNLPTQPLSISAPSTVCKNQLYTFNYAWNGPTLIHYEWTVNSTPVSQNASLNYAFDGSTANPTIGLTVTDIYGCTFTDLTSLSVVMPRPLTVAPVMICPDCLPPTSLSVTSGSGFTNYQWYYNGTAIVGANSASYQLCQPNAAGNYYVTAEDAQFNNCLVTSNTVLVTYHPKPKAEITGQTILCVPASGPYSVSLVNAGGSNSNYTYNWTAAGPGAVTFSPDNLQYNANATVTALGTYEFILTVTDIVTGCMAKDTFCVYLCVKPNVTVNGPSGTLCAGIPHTFNASAAPAGNYEYVWSNGATGPVMTTSQPGYYSVVVTDTDCGCSDDTFAGYIQQQPSTLLFPVGCDTICDNESITPPLALGGPFFPSGYTIQWFLNEDYSNPPFYTGPVLNLAGLLPPLVYGENDISIIVTYQGCSDTSNVYNLFIEECCVCKSELALSHNGVEYPLFCDPHTGFIPSLPCLVSDVLVSGYIGFFNQNSGEPCEETPVIWELTHPDGHTQVGLTSNFSFFIFPKDSVDEPGLYCLTLTTISPDGLDTCICKVRWIQEPCDDCYCGTFSNLFFPLNRVVLGTSTICDAPEEITIPCPSPGKSIQLTGLFQCAGPNCPPTAQVTWELYRLPNTTTPVAWNSTTANPYFGISILPAWYAIPGSYELRLVGHCGQQECPCIVRFRVDCPDPCPCDVAALDAAVNQGFAVVKYPTSCKACFVPVALSDCETVEWYLNSANGPLIGTSVGNNAICHTFPGSGTYTVVMVVTRRRSDGSLCEVFTKSQTVTLSCLIISDCTDSD
ncbi:MAG: HYR domain-containing protein, partial [Saprospiraceae bacterium]|nr:HYR domain-containing protein [Saprospiraceae bacterium]